MARRFRVGDWTAEPALNAFCRGDERVHVEPKTMQVLVYLAEHPGEVRSKEHIIDAVWPDTFVTDGVLWNAISELRRAFGDDRRNPTYIQTVPRKGYRLTAQVCVPTESHGSTKAPALRPTGSRAFLPAAAGAVGAIVVGVLSIAYFAGVFFAPVKPASVAVLPFVSSSETPEGSYLSEAISASLSSILFRASDLKVTPSSALHRYSGEDMDPLQAASDLGVDAVVYGVLSGKDDHYALDLELLDARSHDLIWAKEYHGSLASLNYAQGAAARSVLTHTTGKLDEQTLSLLTHQLPHNRDAQTAYLKGRYFYNEYLFRDARFGLTKGADLLEKTIRLEAGFSPAYHWLSKTYYHLGRTLQDETCFAKARRWAERSLMVREPAAEAYQWMGEILWTYDRDWAGADRDFTIAHELNPRLGPTIPYLLATGQREAALHQIEIEYGMADPWSVTDAIGHGWWFFFAGDYDRAIELAKKGLELEPGLPMAGRLLAACYEQQGRYEEAVRTEVRALEKAAPGFGGRPGLDNAERTELLEAFHKGGIQAYWRALLRKALPVGNPIEISALYGRLGEKDHALDWVERAYRMKEMGLVATPWFTCLTQDPAYERRLEELRLLPPPAAAAAAATLVSDTSAQP